MIDTMIKIPIPVDLDVAAALIVFDASTIVGAALTPLGTPDRALIHATQAGSWPCRTPSCIDEGPNYWQPCNKGHGGSSRLSPSPTAATRETMSILSLLSPLRLR